MLKKIVACCSLVLAAQSASAISSDKPYIYELELESYRFRYNEIVNDAFFMRHKGTMIGLNFNFETNNEGDTWRFRCENNIAYADDIHYKSDGTGESESSNYYKVEIRGLGLYQLSPNWELFTGLGARNLENDDRGKLTNNGALSYYRHSKYVYLPIGASYQFPAIVPGWKFKSTGEFDINLYSRQYTGLAGGINNKQKKGYGIRVALDAKKPSSKHDFLTGIFIRHWNFEDSKTVTAAGFNWTEPKNRTFEIGAKVGFSF